MSEFGPHLTTDLVNNQLFSHVITGFTDSSALLRELTVKSLTHFVTKLSNNNMEQVSYKETERKPDQEQIRWMVRWCDAAMVRWLQSCPVHR